RALLEALEGATAFEIDADVLTLSGAKGQTLVTFERTEEPSDAAQVVEQATPQARAFLFRNVRVFGGHSPELSDPSNVLIEGNLISTISTDPIEGSGTNLTVIDGKGGTLMPGLIDAHWHTMAVGVT